MFKLNKKKEKGKKVEQAKKNEPVLPVTGSSKKVPSVQAWLPFYDVNNDLIWLRDRKLIKAIGVEPKNMDLYSKSEGKLQIKKLFQVINALEVHWVIHSQQRPVNLDQYIQSTEEFRNQQINPIRRRILDSSIRNASKIASGGEAVDVFFYILLFAQLQDKQERLTAEELTSAADELASSLSSNVLESHVCDDQELREALFSYLNPAHAAYERAPLNSWEQLPPQLKGGI